MKKLLLLFLLPFTLLAQKAPVVGNLQTTSGLPSASYVEFALSNCGNNQPKVAGVALLVPTAVDFYADATGVITAAANGGVTPALYGNDVIVCGTASNTLYGMQVYVNGQPVGPTKYYNIVSTSTFNINTAQPVQNNLPAPPINPPQNGQFLNLNVINNLSAGNTTTGNLTVTGSVLGNLSVTGQISAASAQISGMLAAAVTNGVVNPTFYAGSDIGAQVNAAFAANCTNPPTGQAKLCVVQIPPGTYTGVQTEIILPSAPNAALLMDGATLTYSGSTIKYGIATPIGGDHAFLHGGYLNYSGAPNMKAGVVLSYGMQGCYVDQVRESGVVNGDGLLNLGCNVVTVIDSTFQGNFIGVHLLGSPGFASNNVKLFADIIIGNKREGIADGDISQYPVGWPLGNGGTWSTAGASSPNFNNSFIGNDLELNGTTSNRGAESTVYPAILVALTNGDQIMGNYFEATPYEQVKLGCIGYTDAAYQSLYGVATGPNCGTAQGPTIAGNYSTTDGGWDYFINYAVRPTITGNSDQLATTNSCFVNANVGVNSYVNNNNYNATSEFCVGGASVTAEYWSQLLGPNITETDLATQAGSVIFNANGNYTSNVQFVRMSAGGPATPANPNNSTTSDPYCDPAYARGTLWIDTCTSGATGCVTGGGVAWICKDDTVLATPVADGHATWIKAF